MGTKTYSIVLIVGLVIIVIASLQLNRVIGQKRLNAVLELAKTELQLNKNDHVSGCEYQNDWYMITYKKIIFLVKEKTIYFADLGKYTDQSIYQRWPTINIQPADSPAVDFYYLNEYCVW